jgi:pilus assembly protein CpaF
MLQACNTGHDGSLSTVHANSADDALARLETLALCSGISLPLAAVRAQIGSAIDAVVHVARGSEGARVVTKIAEVEAGPRPRTRTIFERVGRDLVPHSAPERPPRRGEIDLAEVWLACASR